jgi:hypothetical protein
MSYNIRSRSIQRNRLNTFRGSKSNPMFLVVGAGIALTFLAMLVFGGFNLYAVNQTGTATACVVTDKDRTTNAEGVSQTRIYTENCGTFEVTDSILDGRFNSADMYGSLKPGATYDFTTRGLRIPVLSSFPNIITATQTQGATIRFEQ